MGMITDFLEFEGVGVPGFSGGPVFDINGKVVALMREAWARRGLQPGAPDVLVNRAFSTDTIKKLDDQQSRVGHKRGATRSNPNKCLLPLSLRPSLPLCCRDPRSSLRAHRTALPGGLKWSCMVGK
jgi:hypothetical protein